MNELEILGIKLCIMVALTPVMGFAIMKTAEDFEKSWKTNNRRKKWVASCVVFILLAIIGGWLR